MTKSRKYFPNKSAVFCTSRTEIGLPFTATLAMNFILWGVLARAREQYQVKVCHFIFLANHFHMLLVVENPEDISRFIGYVKTESAHAVNRLLGRRQRTIWKDGYDSPIVLTAHDVMQTISYIYLNPARANLVEKIEEYPGVSSWGMFAAGETTKTCKRLGRDSLLPLWSPALTVNEQKRMVENFKSLPGTNHEFILEPDAWMDCFPELKQETRKTLYSRTMQDIVQKQQAFTEKRQREKKQVMGSTALRRESMTKEYTPTTYGRRSICKCSDRVLRYKFIEFVKGLFLEGREVFERWRCGDFTFKMPPGLFSPRMPTLVSALQYKL